MKYIRIVLYVVLLGCSSKENDRSSITLSTIKLESLDGRPINLDDYKGKTIFLNFWATWCKPCLQEMPTIEKAMTLLKDENVIFLFASEEDTDEILSFKQKRNFNFEYIRVLNIPELNIQALPTTYIFNVEGSLVFNELGFRDWGTTENLNIILSKPNY